MRIWKRLAPLNKGAGKPEIAAVKRISAHTFRRTERKPTAILNVAAATRCKSGFNKLFSSAKASLTPNETGISSL